MMVKICGITNREDAQAAAEGGASAVGFNFYPESPRYIAPAIAAEIISSLPPGICKVGVFVNQPAERVTAVARECCLDVVQLHGDEGPAEYPADIRVWKAVRVGESFDWREWRDCPAEAILLDGPAGALYGGSGHAFEWSLASGALRRIILAGGLGPDNVREAIAAVHPWGVDACSRLEISPGRKDHEKMSRFLKAALAELS